MDLNVLFRDFGRDIGRIATALETIARNTQQTAQPTIDLDLVLSRVQQEALPPPVNAVPGPIAADPEPAEDPVVSSLNAFWQEKGREVEARLKAEAADAPSAPAEQLSVRRTRGDKADDARVVAVLREVIGEGTTTYLGLSKALNARGVKTKNGSSFFASTVRAIMMRNGLHSTLSLDAVKAGAGARRREAEAPKPLSPVPAQNFVADPPKPVEAATPKLEHKAVSDGAIVDHPSDLEDLLSSKTRSRAQFARTFRGRKAVASETIDFDAAYQAFQARGGVIQKCPSAIDSTGWDHHNQKQVS